MDFLEDEATQNDRIIRFSVKIVLPGDVFEFAVRYGCKRGVGEEGLVCLGWKAWDARERSEFNVAMTFWDM